MELINLLAKFKATISFGAARNRQEEICKFTELLSSYGVLLKYSKWCGEEDFGRLILTANQHSNFDSAITYECNGAVIDLNDWKLLVVPPAFLRRQYKQEIIAENLKHYHISPLLDGTVVTLYWCARTNAWEISTARGFAVSDYKWIGPATYREHFERIGGAYDNLNRDYCYSYIMNVRDFHPFNSGPESLQEIQRVNVATGVIEAPAQVSIQISPEDMKLRNKQAFVNFHKPTSPKADKQYAKQINFGYILHGDFDKCGNHSHIALESSLYIRVKKMVYKFPKNIPLTHETRLPYLKMYNYLDIKNTAAFCKLFPALSTGFIKYKQRTDNLITQIIKKTPSIRITHNGDPDMPLTPMGRLIETYRERISIKYPGLFTSNSPYRVMKNVVHDYVMNPENAIDFLVFD